MGTVHEGHLIMIMYVSFSNNFVSMLERLILYLDISHIFVWRKYIKNYGGWIVRCNSAKQKIHIGVTEYVINDTPFIRKLYARQKLWDGILDFTQGIASLEQDGFSI